MRACASSARKSALFWAHPADRLGDQGKVELPVRGLRGRAQVFMDAAHQLGALLVRQDQDLGVGADSPGHRLGRTPLDVPEVLVFQVREARTRLESGPVLPAAEGDPAP